MDNAATPALLVFLNFVDLLFLIGFIVRLKIRVKIMVLGGDWKVIPDPDIYLRHPKEEVLLTRVSI